MLSNLTVTREAQAHPRGNLRRGDKVEWNHSYRALRLRPSVSVIRSASGRDPVMVQKATLQAAAQRRRRRAVAAATIGLASLALTVPAGQAQDGGFCANSKVVGAMKSLGPTGSAKVFDAHPGTWCQYGGTH